MDNISVFAGTDGTYARFVGVMLESLLDHVSPLYHIDFYLADGGISIDDREFLDSIASRHAVQIKYVYVQPERYQGFFTTNHVSTAAYLRIFIPELVGEDVEKIIYLDCDLIVRGDIAELWETDISNRVLAAVEDIAIESSRYYAGYKRSLGITDDELYFNSGVLLINLAQWRQQDISERLIRFITQHDEPTKFCDQDALNIVLRRQWLPLPQTWNMMPYHYQLHCELSQKYPDLHETVRNPKIVHFAGEGKPWHFMYSHPFKKEFYRFLRATGWEGYVPPDQTVKNRIKRIENVLIHNKSLKLKRMRRKLRAFIKGIRIPS